MDELNNIRDSETPLILPSVVEITNSEDLAILKANINLITDKLETLLQKEQTTSAAASLLSQITNSLRQYHNIQEIFATTVKEARLAIKADRLIVYSFDENWEGTIIAESVARGFPSIIGNTIADPCFGDRYVKAYEKGRVSAIENIEKAGLTECHLKQLQPLAVKANLVVPINANQKLFALLIAHQCSAPRSWKETEIDFLRNLASQLGFAVEQAQLKETQLEIASRAKRLNQITCNIRKSLNTNHIFTTAVEDTQLELKADRVIVYEFDDLWRGTVVAESVSLGYPRAIGAIIADPCFAEYYVKSYQKGRVRAINDIYQASLTPCHISQLEPFAVKANLVVPIIANEKLHGLLIAHQCSAPRIWKDSEIDFFSQVAMQVGFAVEQALLVSSLEVANARSRLLNDLSARLRECVDPEKIFHTSVTETRKALKVDRAVIYRFDEAFNGKIVAESVLNGFVSIIGIKQDHPCFPQDYVEDYRLGRVCALNDISKFPLSECHSQKLQEWQVKANIVVPIVVKEKLYGLLGVHQCSAPRIWKDSEIEFLKLFGVQVAYAFDQALLLQEIEKARTLAESISHSQRLQKEALQNQIRSFMKDIEGSFTGDLTVRAKVTEGEMGTVADFFNATIENLQELVLQVQSSALQVSETVVKSEPQINQVSADAISQVESIKRALSKLQVMAKSIQSVANNAKQAQIGVEKGNQTIVSGDRAMDEMVASIKSVQQTQEKTAKKVKRLGEASQNISRIVSLIGEIAKQTNILALNASIEAKHSGSEGTDLSVIASEVRNLAEQSAEAASEIEQLVAQIQTETAQVVTAMEAGQKQVNLGATLVEDTRHKLTQITQVSSKIHAIVEQMSQAASAEVKTAADLSKTMQQVAAIANQTSNQSKALNSSFGDLKEVAKKLLESISQFKVN